LFSNTVGQVNVAVGSQALNSNNTGSNNVAVGRRALLSVAAGSRNIAMGSQAGQNVIGNNNIEIGHQGTITDGGVIRIGDPANQNRTFIAGIRPVMTGNSDAIPVLIDSAGQLGTINSSRRYKEDITSMGDASSGLLELRPVTFRYQQPYADGSKPLDYGLIAEEVAQIYPDLVVRNSEGHVQTVQYQKLTPMLLNELQKEHETNRQQAADIQSLQAQLAALQKIVEVRLAGKSAAGGQ
jgi:hypothetical protein